MIPPTHKLGNDLHYGENVSTQGTVEVCWDLNQANHCGWKTGCSWSNGFLQERLGNFEQKGTVYQKASRRRLADWMTADASIVSKRNSSGQWKGRQSTCKQNATRGSQWLCANACRSMQAINTPMWERGAIPRITHEPLVTLKDDLGTNSGLSSGKCATISSAPRPAPLPEDSQREIRVFKYYVMTQITHVGCIQCHCVFI